MDAIPTLPPDLPPHDAGPFAGVPNRVVAEWPAGTFLGNLAVLPGGDIAVSVLSDNRLDRVTPQGRVGEPGGAAPDLWALGPEGGTGTVAMRLDGVSFANGLTPFADAPAAERSR